MNIDGWEIDVNRLPGHDREKWRWTEDHLYNSPQSDIACLIYSIAEIRMGWYIGKLAIYYKESAPKLILNPENLYCYGFSETVTYSRCGDFGFINLYVDYKNKIECPIGILHFEQKTVAIVPIIDGCNYNLIETGIRIYRLEEKKRDERFNSRTGEVVDLESLNWYSWDILNDFPKWYFETVYGEREDNVKFSWGKLSKLFCALRGRRESQ